MSKPAWRTRLSAARRAVPVPTRETEANALVSGLSVAIRSSWRTVCGYVPVGSEPGSLALLDALVAAGHRVLLPVVTGAAPLDWAVYGGPAELAPGSFGLREPAGARLGPAAIGSADAVLVPALAVDHAGVRLGRGGGHYDRSLPLASTSAALIAVVRDDELVAELPAEPHDVRMTAALTPGRGLVPLPVADVTRSAP